MDINCCSKGVNCALLLLLETTPDVALKETSSSLLSTSSPALSLSGSLDSFVGLFPCPTMVGFKNVNLHCWLSMVEPSEGAGDEKLGGCAYPWSFDRVDFFRAASMNKRVMNEVINLHLIYTHLS